MSELLPFKPLARTRALQECNCLDRAGLDVCALLEKDMPFKLAAGAVTASPAWETATVPERCSFLHSAKMPVVHIDSSLIVYN